MAEPVAAWAGQAYGSGRRESFMGGGLAAAERRPMAGGLAGAANDAADEDRVTAAEVDGR